MSLTSEDEKVIRRIKEGAYKAYPEDRYVDPAIAPGGVVTFLFFTFLLFHFVFAGGFPIPLEFAMIGTLIGFCLLIPGIVVWYYFRTVYSYLGLRRFQVALSITALDLSNSGHNTVQPLIDPSYPAEYQLLTLFMSVGPGNLLKRMGGVNWDSEALAAMIKQSETYTASLTGLSGALALLGGLITIPTYLLLFIISGAQNPFLLFLGLLLLILGGAMLFHTRRKVKSLRNIESQENDSADVPQLADTVSSECSVDDVLSLIKHSYSHPLRILVFGVYGNLEYTGRFYHTGNGIELREAYLLPAIGVR
jgi:LPXTG-motif cell wall-anchored protein